MDQYTLVLLLVCALAWIAIDRLDRWNHRAGPRRGLHLALFLASGCGAALPGVVVSTGLISASISHEMIAVIAFLVFSVRAYAIYWRATGTH
jgi:hypothetical protein